MSMASVHEEEMHQRGPADPSDLPRAKRVLWLNQTHRVLTRKPRWQMTFRRAYEPG